MTNEEINRTIHEGRGMCWHEEDVAKRTGDSVFFLMRGWCGKCGALMWEEGNHILSSSNPSYTSDWSDYGPMLEWAMEQEWWREFLGGFFSLPEEYINPFKGSTALAEFIVANPQFFGRR